MTDPFLDRSNPCPCPKEVIDALGLAVRYAAATVGNSKPDFVAGAEYVKMFMEQPAECWCGFIRLPEEVA